MKVKLKPFYNGITGKMEYSAEIGGKLHQWKCIEDAHNWLRDNGYKYDYRERVFVLINL